MWNVSTETNVDIMFSGVESVNADIFKSQATSVIIPGHTVIRAVTPRKVQCGSKSFGKVDTVGHNSRFGIAVEDRSSGQRLDTAAKGT